MRKFTKGRKYLRPRVDTKGWRFTSKEEDLGESRRKVENCRSYVEKEITRGNAEGGK